MTRSSSGLARRRLGSSGLLLSELGLGGYQFTGEFNVTRKEALSIIAEALRSGITFIDTAPMYGAGESEQLIGQATGHFGGTLHISGKVGYLELTVVRHKGPIAYRDEESLRRVVAHSLHLLRRDHFDVLFIHEPEMPEWDLDATTANAPVTDALEQIKAEGLTRAIGLAGQDAALMASLIDTGRFDAVLSVMHYDLTTSDARDTLIPAAERHNVGIILGTPLRQGLLARAHPDPRKAMVADAERSPEDQAALAERLAGVYRLAQQAQIPLPELALRYLLSDQRITSVIPGARSTSDLRANVDAALKGPLSRDLVSSIEALRSG